jgi:hypothetical protein
LLGGKNRLMGKEKQNDCLHGREESKNGSRQQDGSIDDDIIVCPNEDVGQA